MVNALCFKYLHARPLEDVSSPHNLHSLNDMFICICKILWYFLFCVNFYRMLTTQVSQCLVRNMTFWYGDIFVYISAIIFLELTVVESPLLSLMVDQQMKQEVSCKFARQSSTRFLCWPVCYITSLMTHDSDEMSDELILQRFCARDIKVST
jgi:hypothetical protein